MPTRTWVHWDRRSRVGRTCVRHSSWSLGRMTGFIKKLCVCLGLGALVTLGCAWALASVQTVRSDCGLSYQPACGLHWFGTIPTGWATAPTECLVRESPGLRVIDLRVRIDSGSPPNSALGAQKVRAYGFPVLSLRTEHFTSYADRDSAGWRAGLPAPWSPGRTLPLIPCWSGLLADSAFFGAILAALWYVPAMARRTWRRHRRLCVQCGYPSVVGQQCPECGQGTATHSSA
jgi:hypothetical protein